MLNFDYKEYNAFMDDWKKNSGYEAFCNDGILQIDKWEKSSAKIMFLLKETYNHFHEIRNNTFGGKGTSNLFWRRMKMWTYIIEEMLAGNKPTFEKIRGIKNEQNNSIAYVNLKKHAEKTEYKNMASSNDKDIFKYVIKDKEYLLKQIDFIKPRIILCSGTFKYCKNLFEDIKEVSYRLYMANDIYLIDFWHPSQRRYKDEYTCQVLTEIVNELRGKRWK